MYKKRRERETERRLSVRRSSMRRRRLLLPRFGRRGMLDERIQGPPQPKKGQQGNARNWKPVINKKASVGERSMCVLISPGLNLA